MGTITEDAEGAYSPLPASPPTVRTHAAGSGPSSRHSGSASPSPRRLRNRLASVWLRWAVGVAATLLLVLFMHEPDEYAGWRKQGCPTKIFRLTASMRDALEVGRCQRARGKRVNSTQFPGGSLVLLPVVGGGSLFYHCCNAVDLWSAAKTDVAGWWVRSPGS